MSFFSFLSRFTFGTSGDDTFTGTSSSEIFVLGRGNDFVNAKEGNDVVFAGAGNDIVLGDKGNDVLFGGSGVDRLSGGNDEDRLYGGSGNDFLNGGAGDDLLVGGSGDDVFVYDAVQRGHDVIKDFGRCGDEDVLLINGDVFGVDDAEDVLALAQQTRAGTLITLAEDSTILLRGVDLDDLTVDDFDVY